MKMIRWIALVILALSILVACAPAGPGGSNLPLRETPVTPPTPYENQIPVPEAAAAAQQALAEQLGITPESIQIREIKEMEWSNSCLGAEQPDEMCLQVIVNGFRVVMAAGEDVYIFHTNSDGSQMRMVDPTGSLGSKNIPQAVARAREYLAQQLSMQPEQIKVISAILMDWPDSCLGVRQPDRMCAQVITPGFRVVLQAGGEQYTFHTDQEGGLVVPSTQEVDITGTVVEWQWDENGACRMLEIGPTAVFGICGEPGTRVRMRGKRIEELVVLLSQFAPFQAETAAGSIVFAGQGEQEASEAEQRSVAEWANLMYQEFELGRAGWNPWPTALTWHREGGIAGFCDDLEVYLSGFAVAIPCKPGAREEGLRVARLTPEELEQLFAWVDQFESFEYYQNDSDQADSMIIFQAFSGNGEQKASTLQQEEIAQFAALLHARVSR